LRTVRRVRRSGIDPLRDTWRAVSENLDLVRSENVEIVRREVEAVKAVGLGEQAAAVLGPSPGDAEKREAPHSRGL
jgi:hypothetical protein